MSTWDLIAGLELEVESYGLERSTWRSGGEFVRSATLVTLRGGGAEGLGEDVTYASVTTTR